MIGVSASVPPCLSIREVPLVEMTAPAVCSCPEGQSRGAGPPSGAVPFPALPDSSAGGTNCLWRSQHLFS